MRLTVLSPHPDDAAFSLALTLRRWSRAGAEITILNFFTRSAYAPFAPFAADVSSLRAREDRRSIGMLEKSIQVRSLRLLDAPLRLGIDFGSITNPDAFTPPDDEVAKLAQRMHGFFRNTLLLAPLALGDHIDHRTVHSAAIKAAAGREVAFYEDLPYASWTDEAVIRKRVCALEHDLRLPLAPALPRGPSWRFKQRAAAQYRSQIDRAAAHAIARYGEKYKGAERIWIPRHSARWRTLLRLSPPTR